ncbi:PepSY domain-containing protein [Granulicella paludicola]|uniref:PepSY domain-containing protein n=1 Tax=Granulicella paludicola TaxID=474951 RepID=UPI0021E0B66D|nr:PepSY domain-containing protein [Granulicella paludicola]
MKSASTLKTVRLTHHYIGVFFAPTILFFAITGGLQMFGLHETSRGSTYTPPAILVHLAQLHKKGTLYVSSKKAPPSPSAKIDGAKPDAPKSPPPAPAPPVSNPLPMKVFFAATALALVLSTCTGLFMSWKYARRKSLVGYVLLAGIACPLLLLAL